MSKVSTFWLLSQFFRLELNTTEARFVYLYTEKVDEYPRSQKQTLEEVNKQTTITEINNTNYNNRLTRKGKMEANYKVETKKKDGNIQLRKLQVNLMVQWK